MVLKKRLENDNTFCSACCFKIFNYDVRFYSIFMALAMVLGCFASYFIAKKYYKNINLDNLIDLFPIIIIFGIIGARLYWVLLNFDYFKLYPNEILLIQNGGISIHGAIVGGIVGGIIYCKYKKINILQTFDILSYGLIVAQAIGRFGNWFNTEAFGRPSNLPIKLFVPFEYRPQIYSQFEYFHPTFLYEIIWNLFVFLVLFFVVRKILNKDGITTCCYLILYSIGRYFIESVRIDSALNISGVPIAQIVSLIMIFVGVIGILYLIKKTN